MQVLPNNLQKEYLENNLLRAKFCPVSSAGEGAGANFYLYKNGLYYDAGEDYARVLSVNLGETSEDGENRALGIKYLDKNQDVQEKFFENSSAQAAKKLFLMLNKKNSAVNLAYEGNAVQTPLLESKDEMLKEFLRLNPMPKAEEKPKEEEKQLSEEEKAALEAKKEADKQIKKDAKQAALDLCYLGMQFGVVFGLMLLLGGIVVGPAATTLFYGVAGCAVGSFLINRLEDETFNTIKKVTSLPNKAIKSVKDFAAEKKADRALVKEMASYWDVKEDKAQSEEEFFEKQQAKEAQKALKKSLKAENSLINRQLQAIKDFFPKNIQKLTHKKDLQTTNYQNYQHDMHQGA